MSIIRFTSNEVTLHVFDDLKIIFVLVEKAIHLFPVIG